MFIEKFQSAAGSKIAVTSTATNLFSLINTAQGTTLANAGFSTGVNALIIQPEDGDIRVLFNDLDPTAANGFLIPSGAIATLCNVPLKSLKLIRTGGANVACSIQIGKSDPSESSHIVPSGGSAVSSVVPGVGATNLGKAEDAAHTSGDTGVMMLAVRKDTIGALAADGDYVPFVQDASGYTKVNPGAAILGPGNPVIDSYQHRAINLTTGADQLLVSSAAGKQIWVYGYGLTVGTAAGQSVSLQDEDDTPVTGIMTFAQYGGIAVPPSGNFAMPIFKLATDKDLEVDITDGDVDGWLAYAIVSV
jgi:hypothetical protein